MTNKHIDYGEPWFEKNEHGCHSVMASDGHMVFTNPDKYTFRAVDVVNLFAGIPDPAEFVRRAKENEGELEVAKTQLAGTISDLESALDSCKNYSERIQKLEEALKFYADRNNYLCSEDVKTGLIIEGSAVEDDEGVKAREALK